MSGANPRRIIYISRQLSRSPGGLALRHKHTRFQQLRGFCHAVRAGGISKAATRLGLSQPTVSLQIQALERDLGTVLFDRRGPRLTLTTAGRTLFEVARPLVDGIDGIEAEFASRRDDVSSGRVTIAAGGSTLQYVLPRHVGRFMKRYPGVDVRLHNVTGQAGLAALRAGEVDFAVGPLPEVPAELTFYPIASYEAKLITALDNPLARKKRITLRDISKQPLILPPRHLSTWRRVEFVFTQHNLSYEVKLEVGGYDVIKRYVELGMGVSIVTGNCLTGGERLFVASVGRYFPPRTYGVVLRRDGALSAPARSFVELMGRKGE
jgi:DNA-binding transcriptional LysR family regulator